tara:strand:- start:6874 stop:7182 length:309 start_codon:yes stop_codon:yes gene_type:complete
MISYIIILTIFELIAQILLKFGLNNKLLVYAGIFIYGFVGYIYYLALRENKFGTISMSWHITMTIMTIVIGYFIFNEKYSKKEMLGFIFGIISLYLLHDNHH